MDDKNEKRKNIILDCYFAAKRQNILNKEAENE